MLPLSALCCPPVTGASKTLAPFDSINFDNLIISFSSVVLISIHKCALLIYSIMPDFFSITSDTACGEGRQVIIKEVLSIISFTLFFHIAPFLTNSLDVFLSLS